MRIPILCALAISCLSAYAQEASFSPTFYGFKLLFPDGAELGGETVLANEKMVNLPPVFRKEGTAENMQVLEAAEGELILKRQAEWKDGRFEMALDLQVPSGSKEGKMMVVLDLPKEVFGTGEITSDADEETALPTVFGSGQSRTISYKNEVSSVNLVTSQGKKYRLEFSSPVKADLTYWNAGGSEKVRLRFFALGDGGYLSEGMLRVTVKQTD